MRSDLAQAAVRDLELRAAANRHRLMLLALATVAIALVVDVVHIDWRAGVDFHTYFAAAEVGLNHGWSHIYDQEVVGLEQKELVPTQWAQPFLSPPPVAWLTAPFLPLPYKVALAVWAFILFSALALAFAWAGVGRGLGRWIAVFGALSTWWVMLAVDVGQIVPVVAAGTVVGWRLLRDKRDVAAGLVLATILLKPNTAILVPLALLLAGRRRAVAAWLGAAALVLIAAELTVSPSGIASYTAELLGPLPTGADSLTLHGALGATGTFALLLRVLIIAAVLATSYKFRRSPAATVPIAILGSMLIAPYLHAADLCLLSAAGWMVWQERTSLPWRVPIAAAWVLACPFLYLANLSLPLYRWPLLELALLLALVIAAWWPLTAWADSRRRAPA